MIKYTDVMPISFLKMESFTGSSGGFSGLRYKLEKKDIVINEETGEKKVYLTAHAWKGPYAYDKIKEEDMTTKHYEFSEEGRCAAIDWLNSIAPDYIR